MGTHRNHRERTVWIDWNCDSCDAVNSGKRKSCSSCGNSRESLELQKAESSIKRSASGKILSGTEASGAEEQRAAAVGPDWFCSSCQASNAADAANCKTCAGPRVRSDDNPHLGSNFDDFLVEDGLLEEVETNARKKREEQTARIWEEVQREPSRQEQPLFSASKPKNILLTGLLCVSLSGLGIAGIYGVWWAFQTHQDNGHVTDLHWSQTVHRDNWQPATKEDWQANLSLQSMKLPVGGQGEIAGCDNIRNCQSRYHHTRHYVCGSDRVCRDATRQVRTGESCHEVCRSVSNHNGSVHESCYDDCEPTYRTEHYQDCHQEDRYCDQEIYQPWCQYDTWQWVNVDNQTLTGADDQPQWPQLEGGALDRLRREADYRVDVAYTDAGQQYTTHMSPGTEQEFRSWHLQQPAAVTVYNLGAVAEVKHVDANVEK